jgi:hypothetical protein
MSERTALEIADARLEAYSNANLWEGCCYSVLRRQHAELERLARKNAAYASLTKSQDAELSLHRDRAAAYRAAVKNIDSEREANAILTAEREACGSRLSACDRNTSSCCPHDRDGGQYTADSLRR